ncbi:MAG: tetratricopeptide repeat protein [Ignavibacteriae bacterium]|nr:tetratricopeptide repeat protein [Ignavibacteriota bacterium]NOG96708.1 tetratricopeptide repeat protein [Ignavibacteriota bacterium]
MTQNDFQLQKAIDFENSGNLLHAVQIYQSLLNDKVYKRNATIRLVNIYSKLNKISAAVNILDEYMNSNKDDYDFAKYFGHFLVTNSQFEKAIELLSEFDFDKRPEAYYLVGAAYFGLKDFENSRINFLQLLAFSDQHELFADAYIYLAKINLILNNIDEADEALEKIRKTKISNFEFYFVDAQIHFKKGMYFHAYELIRKAEKLNADSSEIALWGGRILLKMEEYQKAESYLLKSLNDAPTPEVYSMLGWVCLKNRKEKDAEDYFSKALSLEPNYKSALEGKSKLSLA